MVLFISIKTLKESYLIDNNLEDKYITPNIKKGQDFIIRPIIGDYKFKQLKDEITNHGVTPYNDKLIKEYIEPALAYYVMSEILFATAYKFKNSGLEGENKFEELIRISRKYLQDSETYQGILKDFLSDNANNTNTFKTSLYID